MNSFISKVVADIFSKQKNYKNLIFVLPNQRACLFLKKEIIKALPTTTFLPKIISIENYMQELANISLINTTQLLFEFYSIYKQHIPKKNMEPFDSFSQWATTALHDFNEIDSYLVNSENFFLNLRDIKRLDKWFPNKKPSQLAVNYLQFFEYLHTLYNSLYKKLKNNRFGYQGLIYKEAKNNLDLYITNTTSNHIVFVGFNALNKAEEYIVKELLNNNIATIYWDANASFFNTSNEAGTFLRKYKNEWAYYKKNPFLWIDNNSFANANIQLIGAPKNSTQIKYVGELLSNIPNFNKTALVLADENLLPLMLNSLPNNVTNINITMGYPLKDIPVASLFDKLFKLHLNQQKFNKEKENQFYYKDVLRLLNDSYLNKIQKDTLQNIIAKIKSENRLFLSAETLKNYISESEFKEFSAVFTLFSFSKNTNKIIKKCLLLIQKLKQYAEGIEKEYLFRFYKVFQQLETLNATYNHITNLKTLALFYNQILRTEKLSFHGEPLQGLQLMGMLETRVLDFETVIITSVNEGVLPKGKNEPSFIPFAIKKHFKLPTYKEKDAIFSYHFQRLLQQAKKVFLIYNTETDGYGAGEKSRFITRLKIDNPTIETTIISPKIQNLNFPEISIKKTPEVLAKLKEVFINGISPSALATYIYNPILFYEQKILGIGQTKEVEEAVAANTMGTVIHSVLEEMYKQHLSAFLKEKDIAEMQKNTTVLLKKYFKKHYEKGDIKTGKNKLIFEVSKNYIYKFLQYEKQILKQGKQLKILATEVELNTKLTIKGVDFPIKLKGIIDRIDELDGVVRIIDYKTGKVESKNLKMPNFSVIHTDYKHTKAMQVMLYLYLFLKEKNYNLAHPIEAGIISFKNINAGFLKINFSEKNKTDYLINTERVDEFMQEIKVLISEILNPKIPFIQNKDLPF